MNEDRKVTALVPMKGHSERVHSKNTRILGGKPLFSHILNSLTQVKYVHEIIVDTDSPEIASLVKQTFPEVSIINRPRHLLGDKVPMTSIIEYDVQNAKTEHFLQTHSTSPLLSWKTIDFAIKSYFEGLNKGFDSVVGVTRYRARFYDHNHRPVNHDPGMLIPTQDLPPLYQDNSCFYIQSAKSFLRDKNRLGKNPLFIEVPKLESVDIDEEEDLLIAEALFNFIKADKPKIGK
jgi:CMP-N-acetylneuraminic acid synthetase